MTFLLERFIESCYSILDLIVLFFSLQIMLNGQEIIMAWLTSITHPGADQQDPGKPSIEAVVGSIDPLGSQYEL